MVRAHGTRRRRGRVVEADSKRYARVKVVETVVERLAAALGR